MSKQFNSLACKYESISENVLSTTILTIHNNIIQHLILCILGIFLCICVKIVLQSNIFKTIFHFYHFLVRKRKREKQLFRIGMINYNELK